MRQIYLFKGTLFVALVLGFFGSAAQSRCPTRVRYQETFGCNSTLDPGFYAFYNPPLIGTSSIYFTAAFQSNDPQCQQTMLLTTVPCAGGTFFYDNTVPYCTEPAPTGKITFDDGTVCYYQSGNIVQCGDFLVPCADELIHFAKDFVAVPGVNCKQWEGPCNSDSEIYRSGVVAIGTNNISGDGTGYKLVVKGGTTSEMLQICKGEWCDYVFSDSFHLMPLQELERYTKANKHLPGCTPGALIEKEGGFSLGDEAVHQQEKIEEGFLHLIALQKRLDALSTVAQRMGMPQPTTPVSEENLPKSEAQKSEIRSKPPAPTFSIECFQTRPASNSTAADGGAGIKVTGSSGPFTVTWTGPVSGQVTGLTCPDGLIKLNDLKKGNYTVTVSIAGGFSVACTLVIAQGTPVNCAKLAEEPCKTEIYNIVKKEFDKTPPSCKQWEGDPCSTGSAIYRLGNVAIGTSVGRAGYSLAVKGGILTDRFFIKLCEKEPGWCDYVFDPGYSLPDLYDTEQFIKANKRLPGTVSQAEVTQKGGFELRAVKLDQQKKIEESYLYLIEMNKKVEALKKQIKFFE